jgi:hypothetical protein
MRLPIAWQRPDGAKERPSAIDGAAIDGVAIAVHLVGYKVAAPIGVLVARWAPEYHRRTHATPTAPRTLPDQLGAIDTKIPARPVRVDAHQPNVGRGAHAYASVRMPLVCQLSV